MAVKYSGFLDAYSGMGNAARNYVKALHTAGVDVVTDIIPNLTTTSDLGSAHELCHDLSGRDVHYGIKILHISPDMILRHLEPMKYHIAHFFWETDKLPPQHVWSLNLVDEIWTGSEWSKRVFKKSGVKTPIYVFPQPVEQRIEALPFPIEERPKFLFYSIFQWIERKNPKALLTAYWTAFEGNNDVGLLIKTYKERFTNEEKLQILAEIKQWKKELGLSHYPKIFLNTNILSKSDVLRLHATGDCFVSAHRGEGWGIPIAEAMSMGKPVISTDLGGIHEFVPKDLWYPVDYRLTPVFNMDWIPYYKKDQRWANVKETDLKAKMISVFKNRRLADAAALKAQAVVEREMSYSHVGNLLKTRLEEIK